MWLEPKIFEIFDKIEIFPKFSKFSKKSKYFENLTKISIFEICEK